jgi:excinuclease ABC subunit A
VAGKVIQLRGVEVHNLKRVNLDLPHRQLICFCGVSGSGKTSLALDTLYAEGQRRYIESFSAYTRQFLDRLEKPAAERIDGIPPAIAVTRKNGSRSNRSTVGTATETIDYLRLLFARLGEIVCHGCGRPVRRDTPSAVAAQLQQLPAGARLMIVFPIALPEARDAASLAAQLREEGYLRVVVADRTVNLADGDLPDSFPDNPSDNPSDSAPTMSLQVVLDRLTAGSFEPARARESIETAFRRSGGRCSVLVETQDDSSGQNLVVIDGKRWREWRFSSSLTCENCGITYQQPQPQSLSFNSPLGACPVCEGFGNVVEIDPELVVPDKAKTIREGAIAPWTTPGFSHEFDNLVSLAKRLEIPLDVPFRDLTERQWNTIRDGSPEHDYGGLRGFFAWLERQKYKMHYRVFLSRWRSYNTCAACHGARLRPEALAVRIAGRNIAEVSSEKISQALAFLRSLALTEEQRPLAKNVLEPILARLEFLSAVGLEYLSLDRTLRTLSGGEAQRVALTSALGSNLVNMLYVLDEPSVCLHPRDVQRLVGAIADLRDRGNTVVVVEHEEAMIRAADQIVEIGPSAGERGGEVVFQGTLSEMLVHPASLTGDYLSGRRGISTPERRRSPGHGWVRLTGARGNNLKNLTVEFPLGVLCVVTGVSGAGKSTLVQDTLYGALCRRKRKDCEKPYPYDDVFGDGQIDDVMLVDQDPISRSPRSNPVTYIKAFDEIRRVFSETTEAKTHNYTAGHFSFNVAGGRCPHCEGDGHIQIDMQFLADVFMKCPVCHGQRYRGEILSVMYRGRNIAEVLEMTVREAFTFFRGQTKVQARLKRLIDVGLDYLRLGQPANTLSAGEAQRLKLAAYMSEATRNRTLFILDEPTTGLHFNDVVQLLDCFEALLDVGHSLIVVEHNLQLMKAADYIIDLGPGAAEQGGQVVACGTPEKISRDPHSITGRFLADALQVELSERSA